MSDPFHPRQYWEARLRNSYSLAGVGYRRLGARYNAWMYRVRARVFTRVARGLRHDWGGTRVLDVGSGTGFYVEQWHRLGAPHVTGIDLTEVAVERLRAAFPTDGFHRLDIGAVLPPDSPVAAGGYHAVSAMDVLFHIVDDAAFDRALANLATLLRPGGWLLWSDNFVHHATERVRHQVSRSLGESEAAVRRTGLEIVRRVPMFVLMNYPADSGSRLARTAWTAAIGPAALAEPIGWVIGAALYPLELVLTRTVRESPSTELMICRKPEAAR